MGDFEDRRVLVGVDGDDLRRILHPRQMLNRAGNAAGDEKRRTNRDAGLSDLALVFAVAEIDRRARTADRAAESRREIV